MPKMSRGQATNTLTMMAGKTPLMITLAVTAWLALGLPLWFKTMVIKRAPLDYEKMDYLSTHIDTLIRPTVGPVYVDGGSWLPDIAEATKIAVSRHLQQKNIPESRLNIDIRRGACKEDGSDTDVCIRVESGATDAFGLPPVGIHSEVRYSHETLERDGVPDLVAELIIDRLYRNEFYGDKSVGELVASYSPRYHVTFSLVVEDGGPLDWNIGEALEKLQPMLNQLNSRVANFTVDYQIDYFATPGCPIPESRQLTRDELTTFVNFAEWRLASSVPYPTLNFLLYVPSSPLSIVGSSTNSFIVPQWGGVFIGAPVSPEEPKVDATEAVELFASQLGALLGLPTVPESLDFRIRSLGRQMTLRALNAAASSLGSLHRLAQSMQHIAIPKQVRTNARSGLDNIKASLEAMKTGDELTAIAAAGSAFVDAEQAFFDRHMVSQAYFPEEHRLAVYMPFIGPLCVVIAGGWLRLYQSYKRRRLNTETDGKKQVVSKEST